MQQRKIPEYLFVIKIYESKIRGYRLVRQLSYGKYLYEDIENGFKECFLYADIFANSKYQKGYSNSSYKEQKRNEKIRKKRRKGIAYDKYK